jgi:hypothetical protein
MKKLTAIVLFIATLVAGAQTIQKQRYAQPATNAAYPLKFHVTHSFISLNSGAAYLHLVGILGGANVELVGGAGGATFYNTSLLHPGDYSARLSGQDTKKDGSTIQQYDLQLANGQHELFTLIGLSE